MDIDKLKDFFLGKDKEEKMAPADSFRPRYGLTESPDDIQVKKMLSLCKELDIPMLNLSNYSVPTGIMETFPEETARTHKVIPVAKFGNILTLAVSDPFDIVAVDSIKAISKLDIQLVLSTPSQISKSIEDYYGRINLEKAVVGEEVSGAERVKLKSALEQEKVNIKETTELSQKTQIVGIVNDMLAQALKERASDIHIEPYPDTLRVRYRIDGVLQEKKSLVKKRDEQAIIARLKILAKLDITQRRLPQDGRISLRLDSRDIDLRVSVLPLVTGEKMVLRILEKGSLQLDLERLGFSTYAFEAFKKASIKPHGMILLTGPTGSGKSTTLYALLNRLNNNEKNLITIEDPVEYHMKGITQIQVKSEIGLTFANILRAVLRQNPDVVMVGEIRDFETVDIAIKAALTGHLILSTLHTNDSPSAIVRLMNMGVEPFLIASTVTLIAAQRLCRKVCPECKEPHQVSVASLVGLPADFKETKATFYRGKGCKHCNNTGYFGRVAVVEALLIDDTLRQKILKKASLAEIREYAHRQGMKTLREDALEKCLAGEIPLEEVLRVTPETR
ncbi:MAG: type II/IV secretion system protein [Candidatus Omnitrophica bacterium]|nr:type II/IV secretion system protein [Candidatus Omnitrophota bacterium]